jgi:hypothetical protein
LCPEAAEFPEPTPQNFRNAPAILVVRKLELRPRGDLQVGACERGVEVDVRRFDDQSSVEAAITTPKWAITIPKRGDHDGETGDHDGISP